MQGPAMMTRDDNPMMSMNVNHNGQGLNSSVTALLLLLSYNDSPSLPSPSYSWELANGEQTLDYTPRSRVARTRSSGVFIKESKELSVVLDSQEEAAIIPVFGRSAEISGTVLFHRPPDTIRKIVLKVEGKLHTSFSGGGSRSIKVINNSYTLWSHPTSQEPCLPQVPFSIILPCTFQDGDNSFPLPPSYYFFHQVVQSLLVRSTYQFHFIITRVRHQKLDIWPKKQHIIIPFKYVPRTRAPRPIVPTPCFFSSVKTSPEEWHQAVTCLEMRPNTTISPIICHLFVPAGRIYGLTDTIKFHVQLAGLTCSLYMLFSGTDLDRITSSNSDDAIPKSKSNKQKKSLIRVTLLRQVSVIILGETTSVNSTLGEGTIWPIPPDLSSCRSISEPSQIHEGNIDWEGEVRCQSDVTVGGFHAANVRVKDFIILTISPPTPKSPLLELQLTVPVRLVTDSFLDVISQMDTAAIL